MGHSFNRLSLELEQCRVLFDNLDADPDILKRLESMGYTNDRVLAGKDQFQNCVTLHQSYMNKAKERNTLQMELRASLLSIRQTYTETVTFLRVEFKQDTIFQTRLGITGRTPRAELPFLRQASLLYNRACDDTQIAQKLLPMGYTQERLQQYLEIIRQYQSSTSHLKKVIGICRTMVVEREQAFSSFREWKFDFKGYCKLAFRDDLHRLKILGLHITKGGKQKSKNKAATSAQPQESL